MFLFNSVVFFGVISLSIFADASSTQSLPYADSLMKQYDREDSLSEALLDAAAQNNFSKCSELLDEGADANSETSSGLTALHFAAYYGNKRAVKTLLDSGANSSAYPPHQITAGVSLTPGQIARIRGHNECEKLLQQNDQHTPSDHSEYPLDYLATLMEDSITLSKYLSTGVSSIPKDGVTLLHVACSSRSDKCLKLLLAQDRPLKKSNLSGWLPVHYAARFGSKALFISLCDYESQASEKDEDGANVLHLAAANKDGSVLEYLLIPELFFLYSRDSEGRDPLHYAAQWGSPRNVTMLLQYRKNRSWSLMYDNSTVFHSAARNKDPRVTQLLLKNFGSPSLKNQEKILPIHIAALHGSPTTLCLLWDKGPHDLTDDAQTLLHLSAQNEDIGGMNFLLSKNADTEAQDENEIRPLHVAAQYGSIEHVKILADKDASFKSVSSDGSTVLHFAVGNFDGRVIDFFLNKLADVRAVNDDGETVLHSAAQRGTVETCRKLIARGAPLNAVDNNGLNALYYSCHNISPEVFNFFIDEGLRPRTKDSLVREIARSGHPLMLQKLVDEGLAKSDSFISQGHYACENPRSSCLKAFIRNGFPVNERAPDDLLPIERVALFGPAQSLELLINKGASLQSVTKDNETLLHLAASNNDAGVLEALLQKKDFSSTHDDRKILEKKTSSNQTVLMCAARKGSAQHCRLLLKKRVRTDVKTADGRTILHEAARNRNSSSLEFLLDVTSGIMDIESRDNYGRTPLYYAALQGGKKHVLLILQHFSHLQKKSPLTSSRSNDGSTLIHAAAQNDDSGPLELLLEKGVDPNQVIAYSGFTPLHFAAQSGLLRNCDLLITHGGSINAKTAEGKTAIQLVSFSKFPECFLFLVEKELESEIDKDPITAPGEKNAESWFRHAHKFLKTAVSLVRGGDISHETLGLVLFNAHQCVEASLKGYLINNGGVKDRVHRLDELLGACSKFDRAIPRVLNDPITKLEPYYNARYPRKTCPLSSLEAIDCAYKVFRYIQYNK